MEGRWYLFRLAVTDSPSSIGTDMMKFSTLPEDEKPLFTTPKPLEFVAKSNDSQEQPPGWFISFVHRFTSNGQKTDGQKPEQEDDAMTPEQFTELKQQNAALTTALNTQAQAFTSLAEALKPAKEEEKPADQGGEEQQFSLTDVVKKVDELNTKFEALKNTPAGTTPIPDHTGGTDGEKEFV